MNAEMVTWLDRAFEKEELFSQWIENSKLLFIIVDLEGVIKYTNLKWDKVLGWEKGEIRGKNFFEFVHPDDMAATNRIFADEVEWEYFSNRWKAKSGKYVRLYWMNDEVKSGNMLLAMATASIKPGDLTHGK